MALIVSTQRSTAYDMSRFVPQFMIDKYFEDWAKTTIDLLAPTVKKDPFWYDETLLNARVDELERTTQAFLFGNDEIGGTTISHSSSKGGSLQSRIWSNNIRVYRKIVLNSIVGMLTTIPVMQKSEK